jgi:hypothetical protein
MTFADAALVAASGQPKREGLPPEFTSFAQWIDPAVAKMPRASAELDADPAAPELAAGESPPPHTPVAMAVAAMLQGRAPVPTTPLGQAGEIADKPNSPMELPSRSTSALSLEPSRGALTPAVESPSSAPAAMEDGASQNGAEKGASDGPRAAALPPTEPRPGTSSPPPRAETKAEAEPQPRQPASIPSAVVAGRGMADSPATAASPQATATSDPNRATSPEERPAAWPDQAKSASAEKVAQRSPSGPSGPPVEAPDAVPAPVDARPGSPSLVNRHAESDAQASPPRLTGDLPVRPAPTMTPAPTVAAAMEAPNRGTAPIAPLPLVEPSPAPTGQVAPAAGRDTSDPMPAVVPAAPRADSARAPGLPVSADGGAATDKPPLPQPEPASTHGLRAESPRRAPAASIESPVAPPAEGLSRREKSVDLPIQLAAETKLGGVDRNQSAQFSYSAATHPLAGGVGGGATVNNESYLIDKDILKFDRPTIGINPAKPENMNPIPFSEISESPASPPLSKVEVTLKADVLRMIERVEAAATQASMMRGSRFDMTVDLESGEQVLVRLSLKEGRVQTQFQTDVPGLRDSLDTVWSSLIARRELGTLRWAEPTFVSSAPTSSSSSAAGSEGQGLNSGGGDSGARNPADSRANPSSLPARAASASTSSAPGAPTDPEAPSQSPNNTGLRAFA